MFALLVPDMDFFGSESELDALHEQLPTAFGAGRARILARLAWYLRERNTRAAMAMVDEGLGLLDDGAAVDPVEQARLRARLLLTRAHGQALFAEFQAAEASVGPALAAFEEAGDELGQGDAQMITGLLWHSRALPPRRDAAFAAAARHYAAAGDLLRADICSARQAGCDVYGSLTSAKARWGELLEQLAAGAHPGVRALAALPRAVIQHSMLEFADAIQGWQAACAAADQSGQVSLSITSDLNICAAYSNLNDFEHALEHAERAAAKAQASGWPRLLGAALVELASTLASLGRAEDAMPLMQEAIVLLEPFKGSRQWALACTYLGKELCKAGDADNGLLRLQEGETCMRQAGYWDLVAYSLMLQSDALLDLGRLDEAAVAVHKGLDLSREHELLFDQSQFLGVLAGLAERRGNADGIDAARSALPFLEEALQMQRACGAVSDDLLRRLSRAHESLGELAQALAYERQAGEAREQTHSRRSADLATAWQVRHETERARAEAEHHRALAEAEALRADAEAAANRAKSTFLANMSHELRSPLNAMLGFARLLLRNPSLDDTARHDAGIVLGSGEHLYRLINEVLDLSKIEAGCVTLHPVSCALHSLLAEIEEMYELAAHDKGLQLSVRAEPGVPAHVELDAGKLRQVLVNLLSNAIKFTARGQVALCVSLEGADGLAFEVSDTGVGIAAEELAQLGQAFMQAQAGRQAAEGTGLGLAISRSFVRLMGGELALTSRLAQGTHARFVLPVRVLPAPEAHEAVPAPGRILRLAPGPAPRVLAVDDWAEGRQLLLRLLGPLGFEVREAADGREALEQWRRWQPDLILMDMRMPVMNGREATARIKATEEGQRTVIIALTASTFEEQREEILALGCDDFLRKPFQEDVLLQMLARHLDLRYETQAPSAPSPPSSAPAAPDAARLAALPHALSHRLRQAMAMLDVRAVEEALAAIAAADPRAAAMLAPPLERFEYEQVAALLDTR